MRIVETGGRELSLKVEKLGLFTAIGFHLPPCACRQDFALPDCQGLDDALG
ncbi:hypothetical protein D3C71_2156280 [compost metagenome]